MTPFHWILAGTVVVAALICFIGFKLEFRDRRPDPAIMLLAPLPLPPPDGPPKARVLCIHVEGSTRTYYTLTDHFGIYRQWHEQRGGSIIGENPDGTTSWYERAHRDEESIRAFIKAIDTHNGIVHDLERMRMDP